MNMKKFCLAFALLAISTSAIWAHGSESSGEEEALYAFLGGTHHLIGRLPDSNKTDSGKVLLKKTDDALQVTRVINGKEIKRLGKIEAATADKIKALRIRFIDENMHYEAL
jgi:hypothetical protein